MVQRIRSLFRGLFGRGRFEDAMADELRFHVDACAEDLVRAGVPPEEARRRARMAFGSMDVVKVDCRESRGLRAFDLLEQNVRYAFRLMRKTPGLTSIALGTIAICLGANLAIFAVVDAVLLRPLPFPEGDRLVRIYNTYPQAGVPDDGVSLTNYYERRGRIRAVSGLAVHRDAPAIVGEAGATEREPIARVSPDFFVTLGIAPAIGRAFTEAETSPGADDVAVVTDAYWRRVLGADSQAIGRRIRVDGVSKTIVGILPAEFRFLSSKARLYLPLASPPEQRGPGRRHWGSQADMVARLAPGASVAAAQAEIDAHNAAMERDNPEARAMAAAGFRSLVVPLRDSHVADVRPTLLLVQAGALALLLIGTVNLANLLLIRATGRAREFAVRQAIGAGRGHVVGEVVVETLSLTLLGGLLGIAVGAAGIRLLARFGTDRLPLGTQVAFDDRVALASLLGSILVGLGIALPIAWYNLRAQATGALHAQSRATTAGRAAQRLRHAFLIAQVSLAFVLLAGAGLLGVSLQKVMAQPSGFQPELVLSGRVSLPWKQYADGAARLAFAERVTEALGREPGVRAAGIATNVPLSGNSGRSAATVKGRVRQPGEAPHGIYSYGVGGAYFEALGHSLRVGRFLAADDARRDGRVCVVDEDFARRNFPDRPAIGQRLFIGGAEGPDAEAFTIVGIVGPVKQAALTDDVAQGAVFYPYPYLGDTELFVVLRSSLPEESLSSTLQRVVRAIDAEVPVTDIRSMEGRIEDSLLARRSPALLAAIFAGIALLLTAMGTYGVLSHAVTLRRREIGLRIALGASAADVRGQFVSIGVRLLAAGTMLGVAGAWITGRAMQAVLFDVPPLHVATLAGTAATIVVVSLAACLLPSERAARTSPTEVLAEE